MILTIINKKTKEEETVSCQESEFYNNSLMRKSGRATTFSYYSPDQYEIIIKEAQDIE